MTVDELRAALAEFPGDVEVDVSSHCEEGGGIDHVGAVITDDGQVKRVMVASWAGSCRAFD